MEKATEVPVPREPFGRFFLRFLKFGLLAWGGPVAQIAMIRQELVEEERWVSREHFNRILAVYQVLPGPEAHELCVYFGMLARGRLGGFLAGLGFMLPGFILMFLLSVLYASGVQSPWFKAFFLGVQPAVVALIFRAVHRIGQHALANRWLWGLAAVAAVAHFRATSFWVTLTLTGFTYLFLASRRYMPAIAAGLLLLVGALLLSELQVTLEAFRPESPAGIVQQSPDQESGTRGEGRREGEQSRVSLLRLFTSGLRSGLLTFGGAYTVLPFLQHDAVEAGRWMSDGEFLDGVALSGILPAPFIIFSTFVGYLGGGPVGALILTFGIFLPAFSFTLVGHNYIERIIGNRTIHTFLDGVTAGVVGLIAATSIGLFLVAVRSPVAVVIFGLGLAALYAWRARGAVVAIVLVSGALGLLLFR